MKCDLFPLGMDMLLLRAEEMPQTYLNPDLVDSYSPQRREGYRSEGRDVYLDNAKGLLMVLVVIGHIVAPVRGSSGTNSALYALIYSFHMPMFALLSGYFSSPETQRTRS